MDWIMDLPSGTTISLTAQLIAFIAFGLYAIRQFANLKLEQAKIHVQSEQREADADSKRDEIFNTFIVDFSARIKAQQKQIDELNEKLQAAKIEAAEHKGKVAVLQDTLKHDREMAQQRIKELVDKVNELEKRLAEVEHENLAKTETIDLLKSERDELKQQLEVKQNQLDEITSKLADCEGKKKVIDMPSTDKKEEKIS